MSQVASEASLIQGASSMADKVQQTINPQDRRFSSTEK